LTLIFINELKLSPKVHFKIEGTIKDMCCFSPICNLTMLRKGLNSDELKRVITIEKFEDTKGVIRSRKSKIPKG
jgi:hypothetical protein